MTAEGMINAFRGDKRLLRWQKKGISKGEFFPPLHRGRRFSLLGCPCLFSFYFFCFFLLFLGDYKGALPFIVRGYKGGEAPIIVVYRIDRNDILGRISSRRRFKWTKQGFYEQ